ncbi:MAG: efflux RND transporter permease subunit [Parvibaculaceae bacterium]|nr:efflux RND transporter permease subunit [Parvibaculaceae bacterium]
MNGLIDSALSRTRTVMTIMVMMVVSGIISYVAIPKEADPDIPIPVFYISIPHPGISPGDAERLLIKPMETQLRSLEGLEELHSIASQGHAGIVLEFDVDFDKDDALLDVREKVDLARAELPADTDEPTVNEFNAALFPVIVVTLSGDVPERTLYRHALELQDRLETVPSVLEAELSGHREEQVEVLINPARMEAYNVSPGELINAVTMNNRLIAPGSLDTGDGSFSVKVPGLFETREDIMSLPIKVSGDGVVTLADLADIRRTFKDASGYARFNGKPAIAIQVKKRIGENIIETNDRIRAIIAEARTQWPATIKVDYMLDQSNFIMRSLGSLEASITLAIVLVMIVVVAALGMRSGILVGVAIPTSFMIGFLFLAVMGMTINMMVMFGLLLSVGILVDGAIVVVEYADRKMAEGLSSFESYRLAAKRMFWPIASSTGTTLAAFLPMLLWPGVSGKFMSHLPITLIVILTASFITAMLFLPVLGSLFGKSDDVDNDVLTLLNGAETGDIRTLPGITGRYVRMLDFLVYHPIRVMATTAVVLITTLVLFMNFNNGTEFFVETEPEQAIIMVSARGNLSTLEAARIAQQVEDIVLDIDGFQALFSVAGPGLSGGPGSGGDTPPDMIARMTLELLPYEQRRPGAEILAELRKRVAVIPGIHVEVRKREDGPPTGKDIQIQLVSTDFSALTRTAGFIRTYMEENVPELIDFEDERPLPGIEWELSVDRELSGRFGADISVIGAVVQLVTNGILLDEIRPDDSDEEVEIRVRYPEEYRTLAQLDRLRIPTANGLIPLSNFVSRKPTAEVSSINRIDGIRRIMVKASAAINPETGAKYNVDSIVKELEAWLSEQTLEPGVRYEFKGANEEQQKAADFLGKALLGALFLMFVILLTQFNSFYHTFLTLSTVVLSTFGVLLGMVITGQTFSVIMTGTGIVALAGIVVNNSIVLIDTYQRLIQDGMSAIESVLRTAGQRLRPILLTTITTMFGLLPMALEFNVNFFSREVSLGGPVSVWWVQLSTAIIYGLGFSTLLTLVLVPVLLAAPEVLRQRYRKWAEARSDTSSDLVHPAE